MLFGAMIYTPNDSWGEGSPPVYMLKNRVILSRQQTLSVPTAVFWQAPVPALLLNKPYERK